MTEESSADVIFCTPHQAKGLEWDRVVLGAVKVHWGIEAGSWAVSHQALNACYVAVTKAVVGVFCSRVLFRGTLFACFCFACCLSRVCCSGCFCSRGCSRIRVVRVVSVFLSLGSKYVATINLSM